MRKLILKELGNENEKLKTLSLEDLQCLLPTTQQKIYKENALFDALVKHTSSWQEDESNIKKVDIRNLNTDNKNLTIDVKKKSINLTPSKDLQYGLLR